MTTAFLRVLWNTLPIAILYLGGVFVADLYCVYRLDPREAAQVRSILPTTMFPLPIPRILSQSCHDDILHALRDVGVASKAERAATEVARSASETLRTNPQSRSDLTKIVKTLETALRTYGVANVTASIGILTEDSLTKLESCNSTLATTQHICPGAKIWMKTYCKMSSECNLLKPEHDGVFVSSWSVSLHRDPKLAVFGLEPAVSREGFVLEPLAKGKKIFEPRQIPWFAQEQIDFRGGEGSTKWDFVDEVRLREIVAVAITPFVDLENKQGVAFVEFAVADVQSLRRNVEPECLGFVTRTKY